MAHVVKFLGTFAYTGFFPFAPATFASAVFAVVYWLVPGGHWLVHPVVLALTFVISIPIATRLEKDYGHDPSCVVIDEVVGMQIALTVVGGLTVTGLVAAFFLFRVFDILKPFPVGRSQRLPRGYGVVIDDVIAGVYTRIALIILSQFVSIGTFV